MTYTIEELLALGEAGKAYFERELGYDTVGFYQVRVRSGRDHQLEFELFDEFQKNLHVDMRYKVGWAVDIPLEDFWGKLTTWPDREQRELTILARKMTSVDADLDQIKSAQVRAFVARIQPDIDALRRQLADLTGDTVEIS